MTGEIVNLRKARKRRARAAKEAAASENRAVHGQTKAMREQQTAERSKLVRDLEGHWLERSRGPDNKA